MTELTTVTSLTNFRATLLNRDTLPTEWPVGQDLVLALEFESDEIAQGQDLDISKLDLSTPLSTAKFVRSVEGEDTLEETAENNKTVVYVVLTPTEEGTETSFTFTYYDTDNNITSHAGISGVSITYKNKIEGDYSVTGLNVAPEGGNYTIEPVMSESHSDVRFVAEVEGERKPFTGRLELTTPEYHGKSEITVIITAKADKRGKNYRKHATKEFVIDTTGAWHLKNTDDHEDTREESASSAKPITAEEMNNHFDTLFSKMTNESGGTITVNEGESFTIGVTPLNAEGYSYENLRYRVNHDGHPVSEGTTYTHTTTLLDDAGTWEINIENETESGVSHSVTWTVSVTPRPVSKQPINGPEIKDQFNQFFDLVGFTDGESKTVNVGDRVLFGVSKRPAKLDTHNYEDVRFSIKHNQSKVSSEASQTFVATTDNSGTWSITIYNVREGEEYGKTVQFTLDVQKPTKPQVTNEDIVNRFNEFFMLDGYKPGETVTISEGDAFRFSIVKLKESTHDYGHVNCSLNQGVTSLGNRFEYGIDSATQEHAGEYVVHVYVEGNESGGTNLSMQLVVTPKAPSEEEPESTDSRTEDSTDDDTTEDTAGGSSDVQPGTVDTGMEGERTEDASPGSSAGDESHVVNISVTNLGIVHEGDEIDLMGSGFRPASQLQWYHVDAQNTFVAIDGQTTERLVIRATPEYNHSFVLRAISGGAIADSTPAVITRYVPNTPAVNMPVTSTISIDERESAEMSIQVIPNDKYTTISWKYIPENGVGDPVDRPIFDGLLDISINPASLADAGDYYAEVSRLGHVVRSPSRKLVVNKVQEAVKVDIRLSKQDTVNEPVGATFTVHADVTNYNESMLLQWYHRRGGVTQLIAGANAQVLMIPNLTTGHSGHYFIRVTQGNYITESDAVYLTVVEAPNPDAPEIIEDTESKTLTDEEKLRARKYPDGVGPLAISIDDYCQAMRQGKQLTPKEGARRQIVFYRDIIRILNIEDIDTYMYAMDMLVDHFWAYRETVFRMEQRFRFLEYIGNDYMSKDDKEAFMSLITVFVTMADPVNNVPISLNEVADIMRNDLAFTRLSEYFARKVRSQRQAIIQESGL